MVSSHSGRLRLMVARMGGQVDSVMVGQRLDVAQPSGVAASAVEQHQRVPGASGEHVDLPASHFDKFFGELSGHVSSFLRVTTNLARRQIDTDATSLTSFPLSRESSQR